MPEEFYSRSNLPVITPECSDQFVEYLVAQGQAGRSVLQEVCSGSGRLSYQAYKAAVACLPPIDYRYGWNIRDPEHQRKYKKMVDTLLPFCSLFSISCTPWSQSNTTRTIEELEADRNKERPIIDWLVNSVVSSIQARGHMYLF